MSQRLTILALFNDRPSISRAEIIATIADPWPQTTLKSLQVLCDKEYLQYREGIYYRTDKAIDPLDFRRGPNPGTRSRITATGRVHRCM